MSSRVESLAHTPVELGFGTSGLRALAADMTDMECYINTSGFLHFVQTTDAYPQGRPIYLAGDLRESTPRILRAVARAIEDNGYEVVYCGLIPTPAVAYYAYNRHAPCVMVTGSHIPADRNGIKFYKCSGEVMKDDETSIKASVAQVRGAEYTKEADSSLFDEYGIFKPGQMPLLPTETTAVADEYRQRFLSAFPDRPFSGRRVVFYQHSAVGRDLLIRILEELGAEVIPVGRSETFIPIDSENVTPENQAYFKQLAGENPGCLAIVSTDGDSDRPFVIDEQGVFNRGDELGAVVATWLKADFADSPVSTSDAVSEYLSSQHISWVPTRIGSPYVIQAMEAALREGKQRVVCWEVNGGFMTANDLTVGNGQILKALPTRDAILPIIIALLSAIQDNASVSAVFARLPQRFTQAGLIDNFPVEASRSILARFHEDSPESRLTLGDYFNGTDGFGAITNINVLDGIRITFNSDDIAHVRPSGNAPQLRIYSIANSQERADKIVALALSEPNGIFRRLQREIAGSN
jgi:phosphomannomutase